MPENPLKPSLYAYPDGLGLDRRPRKGSRRQAKGTGQTKVATRVLIVDDHLAIREGIRSLLAPEGDFVVVGEAVDGVDGIAKALALKPDLIVLDNSMPNKTGLEVARELKTELPDTAIVFLTLDPGIRDLALAVGAVAHVSKDTPPQEMLRVLRTAAQGQQRRRNSPPTLTDKER